MSMVKTVPSSTIREFNFFADAAIYRGAVISNGLYTLIAEYSSTERLPAFDLAFALEQQGYHCIVSVEDDGHRKVWTEVRSLVNPISLKRLEGLSTDAD